jgi:2-oxo-hept-3-ene-1,7-dioate hydratase
MNMTTATQRALAAQIFEAMRTGVGIAPPSRTIDFDFEDAYHIRRMFVDMMIAAGGRPCGHKIGFTSAAMQQLYGMSGPDFGILLDTMFTSSNQPVRVSHLCDTRAEPELAFELARPLQGPATTIAEVIAATKYVWAAIEVIDSRVGALQAKATDSLADNAGTGWVVLGHTPIAPDQIDWHSVMLTMTVDGNSQHAPVCDVMEHPAAPLAFLANKLSTLDGLGGSLNAGDIVITGSPMRSVAVSAGSILHADFGIFGHMQLTFS